MRYALSDTTHIYLLVRPRVERQALAVDPYYLSIKRLGTCIRTSWLHEYRSCGAHSHNAHYPETFSMLRIGDLRSYAPDEYAKIVGRPSRVACLAVGAPVW